MSRRTSFTIVIAIFIVARISPSFAQQFTGKPQYQIEVHRADTIIGKIVVEMFPAIAPNSVRNWDSLVGIHFYDSTAFHRIIPKFMIQGGDPNSRSGPDSTWGYGDPDQATVDAEFSAVSHQRGILSAARSSDPNSASSQFFICVDNPTYLDHQYSVYGHVVKGMEVADSIVKSPRDANDKPYVKISMFISRLGSNDSLASTPLLASPADGSSNGKATTAKLRWHHVSDAMMYHLQVATDNSFSTIIIDTTRSQVDTSFSLSKLKNGTTYYWRVLANNGGHESVYSETWKFDVASLGVGDTEQSGLELSEAFPNPGVGNIVISFQLKNESSAKLTIQDILGRDILQLLDAKPIPAGSHEVTIPTGSLHPGIYIYRLEAKGQSISKKMIIN